MSEASRKDVLASFKVDGLKHELHVLQFAGVEEVSRLFQFQLTLAASSSEIKFDQVVGRAATLTLSGAGGVRHVNGLVSSLQLRDQGRRHTVYQLTLVPRAWRLQHRHDCRIFQRKDITQIIGKLLKAAGVKHKFHLKGNKAPQSREYCVQYRESDWNYVCRLLEEEGFFFFFEHQEKSHVMHMGNDFHVHPKLAGKATVPFHDPDSAAPGAEHIFSLFYQQQIRTGAVTLEDYNFQKPNLELRSAKASSKDAELERYDYPGCYELPEEGVALAGLQLEEQQATRQQGDGHSDCIRFTSGHHFKLDGYYRKELNGKPYTLISVSHRGEKHADLEAGAVSNRIRYSNTFRCIPRAVPYRPPRVTPTPRVEGSQTAVVVGPSTEEIHTDKYGRVKVQFHWDRQGKHNEHSSCWVRVSQLWAGKSWGAMFIPRIGHEVVVDFLEGDPDRPLIIGRVYHAHNPVPYDLPANKTRSTIKSDTTPGGGGSNELRFEDKKGGEQVFMHAQKDHDLVVENDRTSLVKRDRTETVQRDQQVTVQNNRTLAVTKDSKHTATNITLEATASITLKVGSSTLVLKPSEVTCDGANISTVASGGLVTIKGRLVRINC